MKENPGKKSTGAAKKTGFYAAIYGAAGIMLALAVIIGYRNLAGRPKDDYKIALDGEEEETAPVTNDMVRSYLAPENQTTYKPPSAPPVEPKQQPKPSAAPQVLSPKLNESLAKIDEGGAETAASQAEPEWIDAGAAEPVDLVDAIEPAFSGFTGDTVMMWPVVGDVVMEYSLDHVIYDKTLDQYRVNDTLCIAATEGEVISAAADGRVIAVISDKEHGRQVVVDNGNGWTTTYSQLADGLIVGVGDVVLKGQAIGSVGSPSIYSILLGDHLGFSVAKDDNPVNPMDLLVSR